MMAYISRLALLKRAYEENPNAIIITERSLYTDKHVFAKMLYDSGKIESVNYQIYQKWFDTFACEYPIYGIIYVKTKYDLCDERIKRRSRTGESNIPIDYLKNCEEYHDKMMGLVDSVKPRMELDGNVDIHESPAIVDEWIQTIQYYLE